MRAKEYSPLLRWVGRVLRYYVLALFGFAAVCLLSAALGASQLTDVLVLVIGAWFLRLACVNVCLVGVAAMVESFRQ